jgi:uncharacterized protein YecE (DUF72 family)
MAKAAAPESTAGKTGSPRRTAPKAAAGTIAAPKAATSGASRIHVGVGGWVFEPWRDNFYPKGLSQKRELEYAASKLTSIEINGTYYGSQRPESFARWREETPDGFVFALKGNRFVTNRRVLAEAGPSIEKFFAQGLTELKEKLGPINWQFAPTKKFDPADVEAFLKLLPQSHEGSPLRHALEVRHDSFANAEFVDLARAHGAAIIYTDKTEFPAIADLTAGFVYARLQRAEETLKDGYAPKALDAWAARAKTWAAGGAPDDLPCAGAAEKTPPYQRDVFVYFINGFKPKAPHAAMAMIGRI